MAYDAVLDIYHFLPGARNPVITEKRCAKKHSWILSVTKKADVSSQVTSALFAVKYR